MLRLYKFNLIQKLRRYEDIFWALLFPVVLATLFYVSFWDSTQEQMKAVPVAVVEEGNVYFEHFLDEMDGTTLELCRMEEEEALRALEEGEIEGIYYSKEEPALTVSGIQLNESILETLLKAYLQNQTLIKEIGKEHPLGLLDAMAAVSDYQELVEPVSVGGRTMNNSITYFFALIAMACLFGAFMGMSSAVNLRADQSPLALRRSVIPVNRLKMVLSEMLAAFTIQFFCVCLLLLYLRFVLGISFGPQWLLLLPVCILGSMTGVSMGLFVGTLHLQEGPKNGILVSVSLVMSFMAGLMFGNMKDIIEHHVPFLNRINPAALISDAFYSISVYENRGRYSMNLILLGIITLILTLSSFLKLRRERYDSL
ncbi:MAG: ABC transporter permease [Lachnospiraceae bacterium]|nr:ABC transporter permease [Lachnospiraceae bacterium]